MRSLKYLMFMLHSLVHAANQPVDLLRSFSDALKHDPTYQAQVANYYAQIQTLPKNLAALLPQVDLSTTIDQRYASISGHRGYFNTQDYKLTANQAIFNYTRFKELAQAKYSVQALFATLCRDQQDLMIRTARAYFEVLKTKDLLQYTQQQHHYIEKQLSATSSLYDHHETTIIELEQTKGVYQAIAAQLEVASVRHYEAIQNLSEITSIQYKTFAQLLDDFPLVHPTPDNLSTWTTTANRQNLALKAARLNIYASREALSAKKGDFLPTLSANIELDRGAIINDEFNGTNQFVNNAASLQANWKIFEGGLTISQVKEASANLQQAHAEMQKQYLKTMADTRKAFIIIVKGTPAIQNFRKSIASNTNALEKAQEAYRSGELTITEVLQIQEQLFTAQTQYISVVYDYVLNFLLLKRAAGTLSETSLAEINRWLK